MASQKEPLSVTHPELAAQADGWDPTTPAAGLKNKVGWKCQFGHTWNASLEKRLNNRGCPICSGNSVLVGFNDLATTHPTLAAQADGWDPQRVSRGSGKKVDWKCELGHRWNTSVHSRQNGSGCPVCSGHRVSAGHNDLATTHPEIAAQAIGWDPTTVSFGSHTRADWKCEQGHTWKAVVSTRSKGNGCPYCSGYKATVGETDLATTHPELAAQAHGWDPTTLSAGSGKSVGWKCELGHQWKSSIANRAKGNGCPVCSGRAVLAGYNDLATTHPELAAQADGWDPTTVRAGTNKKISWRCELGHTWIQGGNTRLSGHGCPVCSGRAVLVGHTDLATTHPELAAQADGWDPTTLKAGSGKSVGWKCELGHRWKDSVTHRSTDRACPVCSGHAVLVGYNDLMTINPELAAQADGWDPTTATTGSGKSVGWKCELGHRWKSSITNRSKGNGCPVCSGHAVLVGYNDLATTHPELAAQADGWDPTTLNAGSNKKVGWKCELSHLWITTVNGRTSGAGCPVCSGHAVLVGYNDLATTHPELAAQADGWDPTTLIAGSNKKVGWKCEVGHHWKTAVAGRSRGYGCPSCAKFGFDPNKNGWLYFIDHDALRMFQVGISNVPENRLGEHSKRGWEVIEVRGPMEGHLAQQLETAILHAVERRGAVLGHKAEIEKFDGYSEAWTKDSLSVTSFKQLLDWVYEDDQNIVK